MTKYIISQKESGQTAIKYLNRLFPNAPGGLLYKQIRNKNITINGKKIAGNEKLKSGDEIMVFMSDETIAKFMSQTLKDTTEYEKAFDKYKDPDIIYEDEHILILNKPVGILSQKSTPKDLSANEWIIGYLIKKGKITATSLASFTPSVCNRLDRNTGGLLLFGKTVFGTNELNRIIKDRSIEKYYKTLVLGKFIEENRYTAYISKDETSNKVTVKDSPFENSYKIETAVKPLRYSKKHNVTELEIHLITGKTHQIRAHMAHLGHPVVGDYKYGNEMGKELINRFGLKNQLLYSYKVKFPPMEEYPEVSQKEFSKSFDYIFDKYFTE